MWRLPVETLAGVKTAWTTSLCRRSRLAVDDGRRRPRLTPKPAPRLPDQSLYDPLPSAAVAPTVKIALHRRVRRELPRQGSPLAAGGQNVEDRLHHLAQIDFPWPPKPASRRQLAGNQRPFLI